MMKIVRSLGFGTLLTLVVFTGYAVAGYGMGGGTWQEKTPSHTSQMMMLSPSSSFIGQLASVNADRHEITVDTYVPGLMGPSERIVPFKIGRDTTISICFNSTKACESGLVGYDGLASLAMVDEQMAIIGSKDVVVVGDPENAGRVVHVQVTYEN